MELLKSAATFLSKGSNDFGYNFEEKIDLPADSFWQLYNGTRKANGMECSLFVFESASFPGKWDLAHNALLKLRGLRHPHIIQYLSSKEIEGNSITIATERVTPLIRDIKRKIISEEVLVWGLYQIAINFINENAQSIHGNLRLSSVFVNESGEWKVFGLELFSPIKEDNTILYTYGGCILDSSKYMPPEIQDKGWKYLKGISSKTAVDAYHLGCLIYEIFNGAFKTPSDLIQKGRIPHKLFNTYKKLLIPNPTLRLSISKFINCGHNNEGFFQTELIECSEFLEHFFVKDKEQVNTFLRKINDSIDKFPETFLKFKILPSLIRSYEFSGGGDKLFSLILNVGTLLTQDDYKSMISPFIVRMFSNQNRSIRLCLLENFPNYINHISDIIINDKIFPKMLTGFNDIVPLVREETIKAIVTIISKLSEHNINNELLKYLIRTHNDEQPKIRTSTIICLGKIGKHLKPNNCRRILIPAFTKSLQDPFIYTRIATLIALNATCDLFDESDCCLKLIPTISPVLIDAEKSVRLQAKKTIDLYLQRALKLISIIDDTSKTDNSDSLNTYEPKATSKTNLSVSKNNSKVNDKYENCYDDIYETRFQNTSNVSYMYNAENITAEIKTSNDIDTWNDINTSNKTDDLLMLGTVNQNENYMSNAKKHTTFQPNKLTSIKLETNKNTDNQWEQNVWDNWDDSDDDNWKLDE
ncbi:unnamed protein product [Pneumocystis jirovecii]|uniref:Protein kinase domain-containing protein n=1 Tax=Pneumocystis jirovecii TaxID=42068 RepID=L0PFE9_PNEJI|nr:unnamed protein product [Pneumocystis jirovecii]